MTTSPRGRRAGAGRARTFAARDLLIFDATPQQLAHAVVQNQVEWIRFERHLPEVELHDDADVTWIASAVRGRPNVVTGAHFATGRADRRIEKILQRYKELNASTVWWVGPGSAPPDLPRRLRQAGFHCFKHFPGMALDLRRMKTDFDRPATLRLEQIRSFAIFEKYEHPYFGNVITERRRNQVEGERLLCAIRPKRLFAFIATIDGVPLGHAMMFLAAGVAGIYDVGTVRRARGHGIGTAVTIAACRHARRLGCRYAVLKATGDAERIYRRIGFEEVCRVSLWFHSRRHHERRE